MIEKVKQLRFPTLAAGGAAILLMIWAAWWWHNSESQRTKRLVLASDSVVVTVTPDSRAISAESQPSHARMSKSPGPADEPFVEWEAFVQAYDAGRTYFHTFGTWGKPATEAQDIKIESDMAKALDALSRSGKLSEAELSLVRQEVDDIDRWGGRRSRTIRMLDGSEWHKDGVPAWFGLPEYYQLRRRIPLLQKMAHQDKHNSKLLRWALPKVRRLAGVLGGFRAFLHVDFSNGTGSDDKPKAPPPVKAADLRANALLLVQQIERKACMD